MIIQSSVKSFEESDASILNFGVLGFCVNSGRKMSKGIHL